MPHNTGLRTAMEDPNGPFPVTFSSLRSTTLVPTATARVPHGTNHRTVGGGGVGRLNKFRLNVLGGG